MMNPKQVQREITKKAKEMSLRGASTDYIAKMLGKSERYVMWVITK